MDRPLSTVSSSSSTAAVAIDKSINRSSASSSTLDPSIQHLASGGDSSSLPAASPSPSLSLHQRQPRPQQHPSAHARSISSSSLATSSVASRKSRYAEPGTAEVHVERSNVSATSSSPPVSVKGSRSILQQSRRQSGISDAWSEDLVFGDPQLSALDDTETPRIRAASTFDASYHVFLPEPALTARSSLSDIQARRLSGNSIYSLASARGILNSSPSAQGSEPGAPARSVPSLMSSSKGMSSSPSEAGLSSVTVTTSTGSQPGHSAASGQHNLTPRDPHAQPLDLMRRSQRMDSNVRSQPDRSRSRAKRRFSGSTANSSHSPSSDRGPHHREKEEGELTST